MKKLFLLLAAVVLSGCGSLYNSGEQEPDATFRSDKSAESISECILQGWQKDSKRYGFIFKQVSSDKITVHTEGHLEFANIHTEESGVKIDYYHRGGQFWYRTDARIAVITNCI